MDTNFVTNCCIILVSLLLLGNDGIHKSRESSSSQHSIQLAELWVATAEVEPGEEGTCKWGHFERIPAVEGIPATTEPFKCLIRKIWERTHLGDDKSSLVAAAVVELFFRCSGVNEQADAPVTQCDVDVDNS